MSPTGPKVSHRNLEARQRPPTTEVGKPRRPARGAEGSGASPVVGVRESRVQGEGRQGVGTHLEPEERSVDSDQQADKAWLLSVQRKLYQWSRDKSGEKAPAEHLRYHGGRSRDPDLSRLYHDSWRAGCVSKGARPVRREIMGNRRRQRRTAPMIHPTNGPSTLLDP